MVRISDARMSGTAYGTVVLHTAPEAAAGGPLALVQNGDLIELDVAERRLHLHVSDEELAQPPRRVEAARAAADQRLLEALHRPRAAGRRRRRPRLPASASAGRSCRGTTTTAKPSVVAARLMSRSEVKGQGPAGATTAASRAYTINQAAAIAPAPNAR